VELRYLHRRFGHPSVDRLHRVLERSSHDDVDKQAVNHLTKYCSHCQKHGKSPGGFKFILRLYWIDTYIRPPDYITYDARKNLSILVGSRTIRLLAIHLSQL